MMDDDELDGAPLAPLGGSTNWTVVQPEASTGSSTNSSSGSSTSASTKSSEDDLDGDPLP